MENFLSLINIKPTEIVRILLFISEFLYIVFSFVLYRQQKLMAEIVEVSTSALLGLLTVINFFGSIFVFVFSLALLI